MTGDGDSTQDQGQTVELSTLADAIETAQQAASLAYQDLTAKLAAVHDAAAAYARSNGAHAEYGEPS